MRTIVVESVLAVPVIALLGILGLMEYSEREQPKPTGITTKAVGPAEAGIHLSPPTLRTDVGGTPITLVSDANGVRWVAP